jgi:hypothetical protein
MRDRVGESIRDRGRAGESRVWGICARRPAAQRVSKDKGKARNIHSFSVSRAGEETRQPMSVVKLNLI